ncbi:MAG TPA: 50S ribosomal protein L10 [Negativicutes bacterium]|uniref:Large ribosomal subunit protein uL10 n=1 Tax=Candidatus Staskawiczbacteria bacterium RIFCSPHIGHO2_01_FULL_41_41 TaxID=1802203 RepID=A0A1G2HVK1_9BACT|nr:MAG: 50S ribosomal protein L10 [Candidatus Staskawiczbacteria bacterium RIFCSPHIGHO2_01_FULL_41_41]OGZ69135.1 MAG: 50S ribosomal protein L10 [Candidatus Staskawiczbacteria bacterium RIFCSPHIGHO2_02_FULL_43_16]OGZ74437.1 MAG: 50S ribosomal protein L10 [Candidatus Staskawiczbacteria bacterium RIFCSPLOWO2_01_FULL_43_17b]HLD70722.1 50S ribosomal protein L10 [Negativicutes bacterium]
MALTKEKKSKSLESLKEKIAKQKSVIFADFSKVNSADLFKLRKELKENGCSLKVGKKTLVRIAFGQSGISFWNNIQKVVPGQLALVFGIDDEIAPARLANKFAKTNENFKILGGIFENRFIDRERALVLANLPTRNELLGRMVGSLSSSMASFVRVLDKISKIESGS